MPWRKNIYVPMPKKKGQKKAKEKTIYAPIREHQHNHHDDFDLVIDQFDLKKLTRKKQSTDCEPEDIESRPGVVYPEIIFYLISSFIEPDAISTFALINKAAYGITKRESFWYSIYKKYCENQEGLPERLRIEKNYRAYGLRQRVIRALFCTYNRFRVRNFIEFTCECRPYSLIGWTCIDSWIVKNNSNWHIFFKLKKQKDYVVKCEPTRVEANPEEDNKCLKVATKHVYNIPPLMGLAICSMNINLSQGFTSQKINLGFTKSHHNITKGTVPDITITLDSVSSYTILDWYHPNYPHFEVKPPALMKDEESSPVLKVDFDDLCEDDINEL